MLDRIMQDIIKRNNTKTAQPDPEKRNNTKPSAHADPKALRLTNVGTFIMSGALNNQLRSYAKDKGMSVSKVCVRAIAEVLDNPSILKPPALPPYAMAPSRPVMVSFIFPKRYPNIRADAVAMTKREKVQLAVLYRRAVYEYTRSHRSEDKDEAMQALTDAWL